MKTLGIAIALTLLSLTLWGQTPSLVLTGPEQTLINQKGCMKAVFSNTDDVGFQPYIRVLIPPELASVTDGTLFGEEISGISYHGAVTEPTKTDPNIPQAYPDLRNFAAPLGYKYYNINLPVGTVLPNELTLDVGFCSLLNSNAVINELVEIIATPVFRFGNDPFGESAPAVGTSVSFWIEPIAFQATGGASPGNITTGSCWGVEHSVTVNVAEDLWMNDLAIDIDLPDSLIYNGLVDMTPGCFLTSEPATGTTGGTIGLECSNLVGTDDKDDVYITYASYIDGVMDPFDCEDVAQTSWVSVTSSGAGEPLELEMPVNGKHFSLELGENELNMFPGNSLMLTFIYAASQHLEGITDLELTFSLPDGVTYDGGAAMDSNGIAGESITMVGNTTQIHLELTDSAGDIPSCGTGTIFLPVTLQETRANGSPVLARDTFTISASGTFDIIGGAADCTTGKSATITVEDVNAQFDVADLPLNGEAYVPGEMIDYQITLEIPSQDVSGVMFELILPVPVHDVEDVSLVYGDQIVSGSTDTEGMVPTITADNARNALLLDYGDVSRPTSGTSSFISARVSVEVSDVPFALGLAHSAIARIYTSNSGADNAFSQILRGVDVGSPEVKAWHGAYQTDNPQATFESLDTPYDGEIYGIDGADEVRFRITLNNQGSADAYNVIVFDSIATNQFGTCNLIDVTHPGDIPCPHSGDLFSSGLLIDFLERDNTANTLDVAYVDYRCWVKAAQYVKAGDDFQKQAIIDWAASPDATERHDPIYANATGNLGIPVVQKTLVTTVAGYSGGSEATVGEKAQYLYTVTLPEAVSTECALTNLLDHGLSFETLDSLGVDDNIFTSSVPVANLADAVTFTHSGSLSEGPVAQNRKMVVDFGNITNKNNDNTFLDQISFLYTARVLNTPEVINGASLESTASFNFENGDGDVMQTLTSPEALQINEPLLTTESVLNDTELFPGEQSFITVTVDHTDLSSYPAFDLEFVLDLPLGLSYVEGSFLSECPALVSSGPTVAFGQLTWTLTRLPEGAACQFIVGVQVDASYPACTQLETCMSTTWTSTSEADADVLGTPVNSLGYERTGNQLDPGTTMNTYATEFCATIDVVNDALITPVISGPNQACSGENITLTIPAYEGVGLVYHWSGPDGDLGINSHEITFNDVDPSLTGAYIAWVEMGDCASDDAIAFDLEITGNPEINVFDVTANCLPAGSNVELEASSVNGTGPFDFNWSGPVYVSQDSVAVIANADADDSGVYLVFVTDANGCTSLIESFNVTVSNAPGTPGVLGNANLCVGEDLVLETSNYGPGSVYHWNTPDGEVTSNSPSLSVSDMQPGQSGAYTVWVDAGQCDTPESDVINVTVNTQPETPELTPSTTMACAGSELSFSTSTDADDYLWIGPNGYTSSIQNPPAIAPLGTANQGTYNLQVWVNGCASEEASVYINVLAQPEAPALSAESPICEGETLLLEAGTLGTEYAWTLADGTVVTTISPSYSAPDAEVDQSGAYALSVFDGTCWSATSIPAAVEVQTIPNVQAVAGNDQVVCEGSEVLIESWNADQYSGQWSTTSAALVIAEPDAAVTVVAGVEQGTSHWITWALHNEGCGVYATDSLLVFSPDQPEANLDVVELKQGDQLDIEVLDNDFWEDLGTLISVLDPPAEGTAEVQGDQTILYAANTSYQGSMTFTYELCLEECPTLCDTAEVRLEILPQLVIHDVITPNGDLVNDFFAIEGLERFPNHELFVFNRWGSQVFAASPYHGDWNGTWNGTPLPEGTYFYSLKDAATGGTLAQGYLIIKR